uniref:Uncharacterized protein n=1 Tax=Opuntia streptacantha TaxID=393608 RepID=A0A7C9EY18_OPUST
MTTSAPLSLWLQKWISPALIVCNCFCPSLLKLIHLCIRLVLHRKSATQLTRTCCCLVACCVPQCLDTIVDNVVSIYYANVLGSVTLCTITKLEVQTPRMNQVILDHIPCTMPCSSRENWSHHFYKPGARRFYTVFITFCSSD